MTLREGKAMNRQPLTEGKTLARKRIYDITKPLSPPPFSIAQRPKQKFYQADLVMITEDLGSAMGHFKGGCLGLVTACITPLVGSGEQHQYSLLFDDGDICAWYYEDQLTLKGERQTDLYHKWYGYRPNIAKEDDE